MSLNTKLFGMLLKNEKKSSFSSGGLEQQTHNLKVVGSNPSRNTEENKMVEEVKIFVNKNYLSVHSKEIKSKAKTLLKSLEQKKISVDEFYLNSLKTMAKN